MQKKFKCTVRILSIILSILMLFELLPIQVLASAQTAGLGGATPGAETTATTESALPAEESDILLEIPEKRDEYTKVYLRGDSRYTAVVSSVPLHYLDDGEWIDIDNTLTETSVNGQTVFTNTANPFRVNFPELISEDVPIRIENGVYAISFYVNGIADSSISFIDTSPVEEPADSTAEIDAELTKNNSTVEYTNILNDTDIQYTVSSKSIKENIIVHTPSAVQSAYSFTVSAPGLQAIREENGSIHFKSADGDDIFFIPAPVMTDDAGAVSSEIGLRCQRAAAGSIP